MRRSPSESSVVVVAGCGMHVPPPLPQARVIGGTGRVIGAPAAGERRELAGVDQSTCTRQNWRIEPVPGLSKERTYPGDAAGGGRRPSRSAGRSPPLLGTSKHCFVAGAPASMLALS